MQFHSKLSSSKSSLSKINVLRTLYYQGLWLSSMFYTSEWTNLNGSSKERGVGADTNWGTYVNAHTFNFSSLIQDLWLSSIMGDFEIEAGDEYTELLLANNYLLLINIRHWSCPTNENDIEIQTIHLIETKRVFKLLAGIVTFANEWQAMFYSSEA